MGTYNLANISVREWPSYKINIIKCLTMLNVKELFGECREILECPFHILDRWRCDRVRCPNDLNFKKNKCKHNVQTMHSVINNSDLKRREPTQHLLPMKPLP